MAYNLHRHILPMLFLHIFCHSSFGQIIALVSEMVRNLEVSLIGSKICDTKIFQEAYDFIIIGAGSGGSVIANRLSEIDGIQVLLLEAGDQETFLSDIPLTAALTQTTRYNWGYKSDPVFNACQGLVGGVCNWPKGKGIGGTSLINYMLYTRGHRRDYDEWKYMGNSGWGYQDILYYFKKSENIGIPELRESGYRGCGGLLDVQYAPYLTRLLHAFLKSGIELGYNITDSNGKHMMGFSRAQATLRNGRRCSAAKAFVTPALKRRNLHISVGAIATKIVIDPKTKEATAVEIMKNKKLYRINVKREVVLSAGAIASPQLLMLSGIGPREHLMELEIPVIQNLRVGYNLQDHVILPGLIFLVNESISIIERNIINPVDILNYMVNNRGPFTLPGGAEGIAFVKTPSSRFGSDYPDIEIVIGPGGINNDASGTMQNLIGIPQEFFRKVYANITDNHAYSLIPVLLRPKSRGRISLRSKNPLLWPRMQPNYLQNPHDIQTMLEGIKILLKISNAGPLKKYGSTLHRSPYLGCEDFKFGSDPYWKCCLRRYATSLQHQVGTCKMGPKSDGEAVVNPQLQVHGVKRLRVVDASVMPIIPAGHTNAVVYMIAEKAADMIKEYWSF